MPNVTTPIPPSLTGNTETDVKKLKEWGTALIDELTYLFHNLDAGNVIEAASVKAENIDTTNATIGNAQIGSLSADKLVAGSVDTGKVAVTDQDGRLEISGSKIMIRDRNRKRFVAEYNKATNSFQFSLINNEGIPTVSINSDGDAVFTGKVESSAIYASTVIGTDSESYEKKEGGVFAQMDPDGIKIMQDKDQTRLQKMGMSVGNDGTAYLVMGAGNGYGSTIINGVVYTNGSFKIQKDDGHAMMGLVGYAPYIHFWEDTGELWLSGSRVLLNGIDINQAVTQLDSNLSSIVKRVEALERR